MLPTIGQVVVTEGGRGSLISKGVARATGSWATHVFLVTGQDRAVEAWVPRVRRLKVQKRLDQLAREDRAYVVLDIPTLTVAQRLGLATSAEAQVGHWYDLGQIFIYATTGDFWKDGGRSVVCSRMVTFAFEQIHENLFPGDVLDALYPLGHTRRGNLAEGYASPADLLRSRLEVVQFVPSSRVQEVADFYRKLKTGGR